MIEMHNIYPGETKSIYESIYHNNANQININANIFTTKKIGKA